MKTTEYNVTAETTARLDDELVDDVLDTLGDYGAVVSRSPRGRAEIVITVPAASLRQAITTALALFDDALAAHGHVTAVEAMTTREFDERAQLPDVPDIPELLSITETAERLEVSRQAVHQRIESGSLPATRVGSTWVIPSSVVEQQLAVSNAAAAVGAALDATVAVVERHQAKLADVMARSGGQNIVVEVKGRPKIKRK